MTKYSTITLDIETELMAWLKDEAKRTGRSVEEIAQQAIRQYLENYKPDTQP